MENKKPSLGDRFAGVSVVVVTLIALLAGWLVKSNVEGRSVAFDANGVSGQAPSGWLQAKTEGDEILHTTDITTNGFGTTYIVRQFPVSTDSEIGQIVSLLTLEHGQQLTAYRVLDQRPVKAAGREAYEVSYVFVESNPDFTHDQLPRVVRGVDYIFVNGDKAVVVTYRAGEDNYDLDLGRFLQFLESLKF